MLWVLQECEHMCINETLSGSASTVFIDCFSPRVCGVNDHRLGLYPWVPNTVTVAGLANTHDLALSVGQSLCLQGPV